MSYSITLQELEEITSWASDQYDGTQGEKTETHVLLTNTEVVLIGEAYVISKRPRDYFRKEK